MAGRRTDVDRFALLLTADVKLVEAYEVLQRLGLAKSASHIVGLRADVARAMDALQDGVYREFAAEPRQAGRRLSA